MPLRNLFSRPFGTARARGTIRRPRRSSLPHADRPDQAGCRGFESLEPRAVLAANDLVVSLVGNRVCLALAPEGAAITNLAAAYDARSGVLTITAATAGTISTKSAIPGIVVDKDADTIAVHLAKLPDFAGVSVVGGGQTDSITIGRGGFNLGAVVRGAAAQGLSIDTGGGVDDTIKVAGPVVTKGAGAVSLATRGRPGMHGILVATGPSAQGGSQTYDGAVTLLGDVAIRAGGSISFSSTVDGAARLHVAAGRAIVFAGDVGGRFPLRGITLATAGRVTFGRGLCLDGAGTSVGTSGLVVGANVHNVVFSTISGSRSISGFSGAGIRFVGGSVGSRLTGVTSAGNGIGIRIGPGSYARTVISGNSFSGNASAGVSLVAARGVTIGGPAPGAGNSILSNGGFGVAASGICAGSVMVGNEIGGNPPGQVEGFLAGSLAGHTVTLAATGLRLQLSEVGRASWLGQKAATYAFDVTCRAFAVSARSTGRLDSRTGVVTSGTSVGFETFPTTAAAPAAARSSVLGSNRVVTGLTPLKTLPAIEFPRSVRFVGSEAGGKHYRADVGLSTFAGMIPLADLGGLTMAVGCDSPVTVDVWVNSQGSVGRVVGSFNGGSFDVHLRGHGTTTVTAAASAGTPVVSTAPAGASVVSLAAGPLLPGGSNGVTGVTVGHSKLSIPYGAGYQAPADWYFPTQADGTVEAQGVIWLQHALGATGGGYSELATQLARQTNSIVVAPTLPATRPTNGPGWWLPGDAMPQAVASLFTGDRSALKASAGAAGYAGRPDELSGRFVLAGHSAGGGFVTAVAADYAAGNVADTDLVGVIMYDGVSAGAYDGSGRFALQIAALDARNLPVYQIAAPAQLWNAYGATTNALMAARPDRFNGVVLVGGSHVDAMLGGDPRVGSVVQRVTKGSSPGDAAAIHTLGVGWINDLFAGATPDANLYGFYPAANQPIIMGAAAAVALPSPIANTLSADDRRLDAEIDAIGGLSGFEPGPIVNAGGNGLSAAVAPSNMNGVTGVTVGTAALNIPCGTGGYATTADWYFPTRADGLVNANAVVWLQHGDSDGAASLSALATRIAQQTNSIVVAPNVSVTEMPDLPGGFMAGAALREGVAGMFLGVRGALNISAAAAGNRGPLPAKFLLAGYAAGGGFATAVGALTVDNGAAANLLGVVMCDGVVEPGRLASAVAKLTSLGIPLYQIAAPPQTSNDLGRTSSQLSALLPDQFVGIQIEDVIPGDFVRGRRPADRSGLGPAGSWPAAAEDVVITIAAGWINDILAGNGPTNPRYGIYGNPNDGTYVAGQPITMGRLRATVLPA